MDTTNNHQMRRKPEQTRAKRTLSSIMAAAAELVGEQGTDSFSMTELAKRAGMSKPALYRYFPSKRAIVLALARLSFKDNESLLVGAFTGAGGVSLDGFRVAMEGYCRLQHKQPFRTHLRAAIAADPELAALNLEDSRHKAHLVSNALAEGYPDLDTSNLEQKVLVLIEMADTVASMAARAPDEEAKALFTTYVSICSAALQLS